MGDKTEPKAPELPKDVPADLRDFIECKSASVTIKDGRLTWLPLPIPDDWKAYVPDSVKPTLAIKPGATPGSATISIQFAPMLGLDVPVSIKDGTLSVDTSSLPQNAKDQLDPWVKTLNDWFKANGKGFGAPAFGKDGVSLSKVALAPAPGKAIAAGDEYPPPATWVSKDGIVIEQPKLAPAEVFRPKIQAPAEPTPGGSPVVGAGGPGGPKAPGGLGQLAWRYIVLMAVVAVLGLGAIVFVGGPALGLFSAANPTANVRPSAAAGGATPGPTVALTPTPAARTVASDDGLVVLTIPNGAAPPGAAITVTARGKVDAPPELSGLTFRSAFYRVAPGGLAFTPPLTFDRIVDLAGLGIDPGQTGYPIIFLAERSDAAKWSWLADQSYAIGGGPTKDQIQQTANLGSAGDVFGFGGQIWLKSQLDPAGPDFAIGQRFTLHLVLMAPAGTDLPPGQQPHLDAIQAHASDPTAFEIDAPLVEFPGSDVLGLETVDVPFTCREEGSFSVGVTGTLDVRTVPGPLIDPRFAPGPRPNVTVIFQDTVRCAPPGRTIVPNLTGGCLSVVHRPKGEYPSYLLGTFDFDPLSKLPPGATLGIEYHEGTATVPLVFTGIPIIDGHATAETGITSYGVKWFDRLYVDDGTATDADITSSLLRIFGRSVRVTPIPGVLGGNSCPP
jgi:hypothetical protein